MITLICDQKTTLKLYTENNLAAASFYWNYLLKNKEIKVNGKKRGVDMPLNVGDTVCYFLTKEQESRRGFSVLYEDDNVTVIDKESGVNSEAVYADLARRGESYFIHRLDRNTCGVMIFAKNQETEQALLTAFKTRSVEKIYHAVCVGVMQEPKAVLSAYLKKDEERKTVKIYAEQKSGAERITTEYRTLENSQQFSKIEIILHTGKTHQIRAHFAFIGNPVLGDMKYGDEAVNKRYNATRQRLVAKELRLSLQDKLSYLNEKRFQSSFDVELPTKTD